MVSGQANKNSYKHKPILNITIIKHAYIIHA